MGGKVVFDGSGYTAEWKIYENLGAMVRNLREKKGFSLRAFAGMTGVSPTYISFLERNTLKSPPREKLLKKMAQVLEADEDEMLALAGRVSEEIVWAVTKHPRQMASLLQILAKLPPDEIDALAALATTRLGAVEAQKGRDGRGMKSKEK